MFQLFTVDLPVAKTSTYDTYFTLNYTKERNSTCFNFVLNLVRTRFVFVACAWKMLKLLTHLNLLNKKYNSFNTSLVSVLMWTVWPDWAIYWTLGTFSKPLASINLPKAPTFLANFCKCIKIIHSSSEIIFGQLL